MTWSCALCRKRSVISLPARNDLDVESVRRWMKHIAQVYFANIQLQCISRDVEETIGQIG